ncbi:MAG: DUF4395 domain-containing protein [Campylobacterota bacterium]|nr:DUF4395 domain-containing protein [Campylobacterota bacterium]
MANSCPLNFERVDSNVSRLSALFVASLVIIYLADPNIYILLFLALDFSVKLFCKKELSAIHMLSSSIKKVLRFQDKFTDGGAKRLAGMFGLLFVVLLIATHFLNAWIASFIVAAIFLACSLLDVFFNYCIGCKVYFIIKRFYPNFMSQSF